MINVSNEFGVLAAGSAALLFKATLKLADGTTVNLTGDDVMSGSVSFTDSSSADGAFSIGSAVMNKFACTLYNYDDRFSEYDFTNAEVVPYVGAELSDGTTEWLIKGYYGVQQPDSYSNTIRIEAYDNMRLLERPYSDVGTTYPATLQTIVHDICTRCGVTLLSTQFANGSYSVASRPDDSNTLNCQAVLSYAMQVSGNFARFDNNGRLVVDWYDASDFVESDELDGGYFDSSNPFASGDAADGGGFMTEVDAIDGGGFTSRKFAVISNYADLTVMTDDVVITGVRVTAQDYEGEESERYSGETSLYGAEGYVLDVTGNPLILFGQASTVAEMIGARVVGLRFRPFTASPLGNPTIEAGDAAIIIDAKDNVYQTFITSYTYNLGNYANAACNAESPGRNTASTYSAIADAIIANRRAIRREKTEREIAMANFENLIETSSGLYETDVTQSDGSVIHYYHDKKTLEESELLWRFSAETFAVSSDGGETWLGLDAWGNAILDTIYAIGINAQYVNTGRLLVGDAQNPMLLIDFDSGDLRINQLASLGNTTFQQVVSDVGTANQTANTASQTADEANQMAAAALESAFVNLITNGSFSQDVSLWDYRFASVSWYEDAERGACAKVDQSSANAAAGIRTSAANFSHEPSKTYSLSFMARADAANTISAGLYGFTSAKSRYVNGEEIGTEWKRYTGTITTSSSDTSSLQIILGSAGVFYVDDVILVEGSTPASEYSPNKAELLTNVDNAATEAENAKKVATNYLSYDPSTGLDVGFVETSAKTRVNGSGVEVFDGNGDSALFAGLESDESVVRIGVEGESNAKITNRTFKFYDSTNAAFFDVSDLRGSDGYYHVTETSSVSTISQISFSTTFALSKLYKVIFNGSDDLTAVSTIRYGAVYIPSYITDQYPIGTSVEIQYGSGGDNVLSMTFGKRKQNSMLAPLSVAMGSYVEASGEYSQAFGSGAVASGYCATAFGQNVYATYRNEFAVGSYNVISPSGSGNNVTFCVGDGTGANSRSDALELRKGGDLWIRGAFTQNSDRRLKEHVSYLKSDAVEFVRKLKPALFVKDGERHLGFYAQDVDDADEWSTATVTAQHTDESLDFDPLTLDYTALIAPLTAYAQSLEKRIEELERRLSELGKD